MNAFARPAHPPIPVEEFEQAELLAVEKEAIGLFVSAHPLKPLREIAARAHRLPAGGARRPPRQGLGDGRRDHRRGQAHPHPLGRSDDVRHARRSRWRRRDARVRQGARPSTRPRSRSTRSCSCADGSITRKPARPASSPRASSVFAPSEQEIERRPQAGRRRGSARPSRSPSRCSARGSSPASRRARSRSVKQLVEDYPGPAEVRARDRSRRRDATPAPGRGLSRAEHAERARRAGEHRRLRSRSRAGLAG